MHPWPDSVSTLREILVQVYIIIALPSVTNDDIIVQGHDNHCVVKVFIGAPCGEPILLHTQCSFLFPPVPITISCCQKDLLVFCLAGFSGNLIAKTSLHYCLFIDKEPEHGGLLGSTKAKVICKPTLFWFYLEESQNSILVLKVTDLMNCCPWPAY